jgi:hypothetical protein
VTNGKIGASDSAGSCDEETDVAVAAAAVRLGGYCSPRHREQICGNVWEMT